MKKFTILFVAIIVVACQGQETKKSSLNIKPRDEFYTVKQNNAIVKLSSNQSYPGSFLHAKLEYIKPIKQVLFGFLNVSTISRSKPNNNLWEDDILIPAFEPGRKTLFLTIIDESDASIAVSTEIDIMEKPAVHVNYSPDVKSDQLITVTGKNVKSVVYSNSSKEGLFSLNNNGSFTLTHTVHDGDKIIAKDIHGLSQEIDIGMPGYSYSMVGKQGSPYKYIAKATLFSDDLTYICEIKPPNFVNDMIKDFVNVSIEKKIPGTFGQLIVLKGLSPDEKNAIILTRYTLTFKDYIDSGRKLGGINVYNYYLLNIPTGTYHHFAFFISKGYKPLPTEGGLYKEIGSSFQPIYWDSNKLYFVQVVKDEDFFTANDIANYPEIQNMNNRTLNQSMKGQPKIVYLDLTSYSLVDVNDMKPFNSFVCWADQGLGVVSWIDIKHKNHILSQLATLETMGYIPTHVSDYTGKHVWDINECVSKYCKRDVSNMNVDFIGASIIDNDRYALISVGGKDIRLILMMNLVTGSIQTLVDGPIIINNINHGFDSYPIVGSATAGKTYLVLGVVPDRYMNDYDRLDEESGGEQVIYNKSDIKGLCLFEISDFKLKFRCKLNSPGQYPNQYFLEYIYSGGK